MNPMLEYFCLDEEMSEFYDSWLLISFDAAASRFLGELYEDT